MTRVLMVLTAADHWTLTDGTKQPTGVWARSYRRSLHDVRRRRLGDRALC